MDPKISKTGIWLIGAHGAVSTCTIAGVLALQKKIFAPIGMVTEGKICEKIPLLSFDNMVFGGWEIRSGSLLETASLLCERDGLLSKELIQNLAEDFQKIEKNIRPGCAFNSPRFSDEKKDLHPFTNNLEALEKIRQDLLSFQQEHNLSRVVVVNLCTTMGGPESLEKMKTLGEFQEAVEKNEPLPVSLLYAYGAIDLGFGFINFTPSPGTELLPLQELALERGVPHIGKDGKTGETLLKTVLAPLFAARNLKVLSWVGYNILGNLDGEALQKPESNRAKIKTKDSALKTIVNSDVFSRVGIDFVPSLGDWKTAWDFIHFQGFLNTKMSLQFTWQGSDSMLAAPLVLDLVRLIDFAMEKKESGPARHLASFFKSPMNTETHNFHEQIEMLRKYVEKHATL